MSMSCIIWSLEMYSIKIFNQVNDQGLIVMEVIFKTPLLVPAWKVGDRRFETHSGLQISKKENVYFTLTRKNSILLRDREVAYSASDRHSSNFESCVWRALSSHLSHHFLEVLLAQFSLHVDTCYLVWLIYCARPSHTDRHFVCIASRVNTTLQKPKTRMPRNWDEYFKCLWKPGHFQHG